MKALVKGPRRIYKFFYSNPHARKTRINEEPEPYDLLSDQEIELEV
jgi:hypothetical protein